MPCCIRRSSKIWRSPSRTTGSTTVLFKRTRIGRFSVPTLTSDAEEGAIPGTRVGIHFPFGLILKIAAVRVLLRGVRLTGPGITMIVIRAVAHMIQGLMQEGASPRRRSTKVEPTMMVTIETVRVEAGPSFLAPSASLGPSAQLTSLPISDWRRESANSRESPNRWRR